MIDPQSFKGRYHKYTIKIKKNKWGHKQTASTVTYYSNFQSVLNSINFIGLFDLPLYYYATIYSSEITDEDQNSNG